MEYDPERPDDLHMNILKKVRNAVRGGKQRWGTAAMKRSLWNDEFSSGYWESLENTADDMVYSYIKKYCGTGSILDLGCGSGNTGCELDATSYRTYTGVDISDVALQKAGRRSELNNRREKNSYVLSDIASYIPDTDYDVILFRESIYYIPAHKIKPTLERYSRHLKQNGVLIVKWHDEKVAETLTPLLQENFRIIERSPPNNAGSLVIIFR